VFADLTSGPLVHLPSGSFAANAAWVTCAAMSYNLTRAAGALAGTFHAKARGATIRSHLITVAARIARHGRCGITLHLPGGCPGRVEVLLVIVFAAPALLVSAVILAVIVASIHREERHMSLKDAPATRVEAAVRRLLGAGVRQPQDRTLTTQADRR